MSLPNMSKFELFSELFERLNAFTKKNQIPKWEDFYANSISCYAT